MNTVHWLDLTTGSFLDPAAPNQLHKIHHEVRGDEEYFVVGEVNHTPQQAQQLINRLHPAVVAGAFGPSDQDTMMVEKIQEWAAGRRKEAELTKLATKVGYDWNYIQRVVDKQLKVKAQQGKARELVDRLRQVAFRPTELTVGGAGQSVATPVAEQLAQWLESLPTDLDSQKVARALQQAGWGKVAEGWLTLWQQFKSEAPNTSTSKTSVGRSQDQTAVASDPNSDWFQALSQLVVDWQTAIEDSSTFDLVEAANRLLHLPTLPASDLSSLVSDVLQAQRQLGTVAQEIEAGLPQVLEQAGFVVGSTNSVVSGPAHTTRPFVPGGERLPL